MPEILFKNIYILAILGLLGACGHVQPTLYPNNIKYSEKQKVIKIAEHQVGVSYHFGGESPVEGFDCSGLVYYSYQQIHVNLPRTTLAQLKYSVPVSRKELRPGDLVFFRIHRSRISHVGIYLGNNRFIHAPSTGKSVTISHLNSPYWKKRFIRAGRILHRWLRAAGEVY